MEDQLSNIIQPESCPKCGSTAVKAVKYTWWGGLLGPKLFNHTKCSDCKFLYNRKTGKSNTTSIALYFIITFVVMFALVYFVRTM